jgi:hypothetical protein
LGGAFSRWSRRTSRARCRGGHDATGQSPFAVSVQWQVHHPSYGRGYPSVTVDQIARAIWVERCGESRGRCGV